MERVSFVYNKDTYNAYDAQRIVFEASKYKSEITFADGNKRANAPARKGGCIAVWELRRGRQRRSC